MKWLIVPIVLVGLVLAAAEPAAAEPDTARISNLKVSVWPEYDEPRVLVMYEGRLEAAASRKRCDSVSPRGPRLAKLAPSRSPTTSISASSTRRQSRVIGSW